MKKRRQLKTISRRITRALPTGAVIPVADNSGARIISVISVKGHKTRLRRQPAAKVGDMIICSVKKGSPKLRRQIVHAVIIRQKKPYKRSDGSWVYFEDNAVCVTNEQGEPRGSEIRGAVAKEAADSWPRIASAARVIS
ncbi:50S ribosomal protein L14 [Candidatus Hodarchaeum mangrovi]